MYIYIYIYIYIHEKLWYMVMASFYIYSMVMASYIYIIHNPVQLASIILSIIGGFYQHCWHSIIGQRLSIIRQCVSEISVPSLTVESPCEGINC